MLPAQNLFLKHEENEVCLGVDRMNRFGSYDFVGDLLLMSEKGFDSKMSEEESRNSSLNEPGSSSRDLPEDKDEGWLQLGIGGGESSFDNSEPSSSTRSRRRKPKDSFEFDVFSDKRISHSPLIPPLQIFESRRRPELAPNTSPSPPVPLYLHQRQMAAIFRPPEITTNQRENTRNAADSSPTIFYSGQFPPFTVSGFRSEEVGSSLTRMRLTNAPSRHQSGVWFIFLASPSQRKVPFLPQISKSYLKIKNGRMTVGLLTRYLINKLGLDNESEVEITCRDQRLEPDWTLRHVRDHLWCSRDPVTLLPDSSTVDHLMILHYGRRG